MSNHHSSKLVVLDKIRSLEKLQTLSKHEKLVQGILDAIDDNVLRNNDSLPSVNKMISELGYARETIVKAYRELIERGVIASKNRKGYFVVSENTRQKQKIALVMYAFDTFQETLYQSLRANTEPETQLDLYFHHNNPDVFEAIFNRILGNYSLYIVAPVVSGPAANAKIKQLLVSLPPSKLLIIDRYLDLGNDYSYIVQEFEASSYSIFQQLKERLGAYDEIVFFFRKHTAEPEEILRSFERFINESGLKGRVEIAYKPGSVKKRTVYFTIHNPELYAILKDVMNQNWEPGKDLGVLAHNDDVVKEIIAGGITTFSTDFKRIGILSASFARNRQKIRMVVPTTLFYRKSL